MIFDFLRLGPIPPRTDRHRLAGSTTLEGTPAKSLVTVFDRLTKALIAAKWSNATTGAWEMAGLPEYPLEGLTINYLDYTGMYEAVIHDRVSQVTGT